jgi:putative transposase
MGLRGRQLLKDEEFFFITTTVVHHARVFIKIKYCEILLQNIRYYQQQYKFDILGYVIMPSHFHWIVEVNLSHGSVSDIMRDIKKYSAWDLMEAIEHDGQTSLLKLFMESAQKNKSQRRKFWMSRFDDEVIQNEAMLLTKLDYIHNNPVKAGLVENPEDYRFSSARNYSMDDHSVIKVKTDWN